MEELDIYESTKNEINGSAIVHHSVIMGVGNVIMEGVIIREGVQIGDSNYFGPYCIIGDFPEKHGYFGKYGKVLIGNSNVFTKQCTVDSGTDGVTIVKNNVMMLKNSHIGHDSYIEDGAILSCNTCVGGHSKIGKGSNLGLGSVVHQRLTVPDGIMIGMNSTVTKRSIMQAGRKYAGSPIRDIGENKR